MFDVQVLENITEYRRLMTAHERTVENVETLSTCSDICMDNTFKDRVNSWSYNMISQECECTWVDIDASYCTRNIDMTRVSDYVPNVWYNPVVAMVQTRKSLSCGKTNSFLFFKRLRIS